MYTIEEYDKEKSKVLRYVLYKKRSKQEIKNKFYNSIEDEMLNEIIDELEENGYINDRNYIQKTIKEFVALNNLSLKEVRYKLASKGISNDLIEEYEIKSAKMILIKKQSTMEEESIIQFLMKKGYKTKNIRQAIELLDEN